MKYLYSVIAVLLFVGSTAVLAGAEGDFQEIAVGATSLVLSLYAASDAYKEWRK